MHEETEHLLRPRAQRSLDPFLQPIHLRRRFGAAVIPIIAHIVHARIAPIVHRVRVIGGPSHLELVGPWAGASSSCGLLLLLEFADGVSGLSLGTAVFIPIILPEY